MSEEDLVANQAPQPTKDFLRRLNKKGVPQLLEIQSGALWIYRQIEKGVAIGDELERVIKNLPDCECQKKELMLEEFYSTIRFLDEPNGLDFAQDYVRCMAKLKDSIENEGYLKYSEGNSNDFESSFFPKNEFFPEENEAAEGEDDQEGPAQNNLLEEVKDVQQQP
jgi:hypothetical protein